VGKGIGVVGGLPYAVGWIEFTSLYDFTANDGAKNIGAWIDAAAVKVGR
jgi:hypothetical protein